MWKFFNRRKGEQPNVPPATPVGPVGAGQWYIPANGNIIQVPKSNYMPELKLGSEFGDQELMDLIRLHLRAGGTVILELPDDGS